MAKVDSVERLREIYADASPRAVAKQITRIDPHAERFINASPFLVMSTFGVDGLCDISPKGDAPGFVGVIDEKTLAIPDRRGNNRLDGLTNLIDNPAIGLIFFLPGMNETLRVQGTAEIRDDADLLERFAENGKTPASVTMISVSELYFHCAKALMRSNLWDPAHNFDRSTWPSIGQIIKDQAELDIVAESQEEMIEHYKNTMD
ncbi:MAG: pyridoxamine 5'-phosphate oxidase family protein [Alphaproteobacteria bacterium]|jgi:uncharacterized protein|nr:pyridoxamine 5'-phosphate oxidase family protein [Alphaproteobacteria bacterium]MBT4083862.1 pyridoxamine 5'-phosphate oxidase family protein [Alphaproteobacteria bacterium]MBT4546164.1 pyridoxamine 5'-phosphate oxidase family protein [Alphaproteobacteria bacterium]MBT7747588.1 pyridoxamine 5'-phosphate oxidase family protein [Alphaproteobacteria bacterium]